MTNENFGVVRKNAPDSQGATSREVNFSSVGLIGKFRRQYKEAFECEGMTKTELIFGERLSSWYSHDVAKGFFDNQEGGSLVVKSAYNVDSTQSSALIKDQAVEDLFEIKSAYLGLDSFGAYGNNVGYTIETGYRFTTSVFSPIAASDMFGILSAITDIKVGDILKFETTGGDVYKKVASVEESSKKVFFESAFDAVKTAVATDVVGVMGVKIRTYLKMENGRIDEVSRDTGTYFCSMNPDDVENYIVKIHESNTHIRIIDKLSESTPSLLFPVDVTSISFLTGGTDGTFSAMPTDDDAFEDFSIVSIMNSDIFTRDYYDALEIKMRNREKTDFPVVGQQLPNNMSATQLIQYGQAQQRSDDVLKTVSGKWLYVKNPFTSSPSAAPREVPAVGHLLGLHIATMNNLGVHEAPNQETLPILGAIGVVGSKLKPSEITSIAKAGINIFQDIQGKGIILQSFFTPSTSTAWQWATTLYVRNYVGERAKALSTTYKGGPNSDSRISINKDSINFMMYDLYEKGSTGRTASGEFFGQQKLENGKLQPLSELYTVLMDPRDNTPAILQTGKRIALIRFQFVAQTTIIELWVGI